NGRFFLSTRRWLLQLLVRQTGAVPKGLQQSSIPVKRHGKRAEVSHERIAQRVNNKPFNIRMAGVHRKRNAPLLRETDTQPYPERLRRAALPAPGREGPDEIL